MLLPGLTPSQDRYLGEVLWQIGSVTLPLFVDADVAGQRARHYSRPSGRPVADIVDTLCGINDAPRDSAAFALGMAVGVRMGRAFRLEACQARARRRFDAEYYKLDHAGRTQVRTIVRHIREGGAFVLLKDGRAKSRFSAQRAQREQADLTTWMQRAGRAARQLQP